MKKYPKITDVKPQKGKRLLVTFSSGYPVVCPETFLIRFFFCFKDITADLPFPIFHFLDTSLPFDYIPRTKSADEIYSAIWSQ